MRRSRYANRPDKFQESAEHLPAFDQFCLDSGRQSAHPHAARRGSVHNYHQGNGMAIAENLIGPAGLLAVALVVLMPRQSGEACRERDLGPLERRTHHGQAAGIP
jgi:hypothetical protein